MSIAGKLWRMMVGFVKQETVCNHWAPLFMGIGLAKKIDELERDEEIGLDSFGLGLFFILFICCKNSSNPFLYVLK